MLKAGFMYNLHIKQINSRSIVEVVSYIKNNILLK